MGQEVRWEPEPGNVMRHNEGLNVMDSEWEATGGEGGWARLDLHFGQMTVLSGERLESRETGGGSHLGGASGSPKMIQAGPWGPLENQEVFCW